jgi:hypothetical protein
MIGFYEIFSGTRLCGAQSRNIACIRPAGRGQAEHWLQRVPVSQFFEFMGRQVAEG